MNKKKFKRVLVVLGGTSGERAVSLSSGKACIKALKKKKYVVSIFDPKFKNLNLINKTKYDVIFKVDFNSSPAQAVVDFFYNAIISTI